MSKAILAWSLVFTISILSGTTSTTVHKIEALAQENATSILTNNNNTITNANKLINQGISLLIVGKYNEAISLFDKVLAVDPTNTLALTNKGTTLAYLQKYDQAISLFDKALDIEPNNTSILDSKGNVLVSLHKYNQAISLFDKALNMSQTM